MRVSTIDESLARFLADPTVENWTFMRERILASADYDPYSELWQGLHELLDARRFRQLLRRADGMRSWAGLCPRWHFLCGMAAIELGDFATAQASRAAVQACLSGILASGEGTLEDPWFVAYPTDVYDILQALGEEASGQKLIEDAGRFIDQMRTESGGEYFFDVTDMLGRGKRAADSVEVGLSRSVHP